MPNAANIATTPEIDIVVLLLNWRISSITRQDKKDYPIISIYMIV
jgi:hypothetical protein